jgi:RNA polymerase sigma-70 factor (ECF subfamily)
VEGRGVEPESPGSGTGEPPEGRQPPRGTGDLDPAAPAALDEVLVRQAGLGDKVAFSQLAQRHGPGLYRYLLRLLNDGGDADDCAQETLLAAWKGLPGFRGESSVRTWLFVLARHEAQAVLRRRARVPSSGSLPVVDVHEAAEELRDLRADPEGDTIATGLLAALDASLLLLPERQRSVWILREVEDLPYAEIAEVLDTTPAAVRGLLQRARATIATTLEEWR